MSSQELFRHFYTEIVMKNDKYVDEVCHDCASAYGAEMSKGHLATYYEGICDGCGLWKVITGARDFRYPKIKKIALTKENKEKIISELKSVRTKYQSQGNAMAVDEIDSQINAFLD